MNFDLSQAAITTDSSDVEFEVNGKRTGIVFEILSPAHEVRRAYDLKHAREITAKGQRSPSKIGQALFKDPEENIADKNEEILLAVVGWKTRTKPGEFEAGITLDGKLVPFSRDALRSVIEAPRYVLVRNFLVSALEDARNFTTSSSAI
ncbi:MAG: hypothetical protein JNM76_14595 [Betaproteobacteria bacterium]|nr:hypothetical protein [Betaproteobacteria bacterium]